MPSSFYDALSRAIPFVVIRDVGRDWGNVLEHGDPAEGCRFLDLARARATQGVLLVRPAVHFHQGEVYGSPRQAHRSFWTAGDLAGDPGADLLVWRRQLVAFLPTGRPRARLPRPAPREAVGILLRWVAGRVLGETRGEIVLDRRRRRGGAGSPG